MRGTSFLHYHMLVHTPFHKMWTSDDFMGDMHNSMLDRVLLYLQSSFNHNRNFFAVFSDAHDVHFLMAYHKISMS